jgi:chitinase
MVWEVSHDYIEGTGNPILDSIAVVLRDDSTTALSPRKVLSTGSPRQQNATRKQVDALGKLQSGNRGHNKRPIILLDVGGK